MVDFLYMCTSSFFPDDKREARGMAVGICMVVNTCVLGQLLMKEGEAWQKVDILCSCMYGLI